MRDLALNAIYLVCLLAASPVMGDVYMQNPRGSNNRNCRRTNENNRQNGNRLFDSQNNDAGGVPCAQAKPFACYEYDNNGLQRLQCNTQRAEVGPSGLLTTGDTDTLTVTPEIFYYSGSTMNIEWTNQHGGGDNENVLSESIFQYSCDEQMTDNCGADVPAVPASAPGMCPSARANPNAATCVMREGYVTRNQGNNRDDQATDRIGTNAADQSDYRYGRHEPLSYYTACENRERNMGLWTADQNLATNDATSTRQNPNANRYGLECAEEKSYYPYWHDSPWLDIAVMVDDGAKCPYYQANSQNVVGKGRCDCNAAACAGAGNLPNNEQACIAKGGNWCMDASHGLAAPECFVGEYHRENHLGNVGAGGQAAGYNWTLPTVTTETRCVLRMRYNLTVTDFDGVAVNGDARYNGANSPIKDNDEQEELSYRQMEGVPGLGLGFAVNTDQMARTFEDRSFAFILKPRPAGVSANTVIHNLNTRGKRGNIVQTYPSTEYDFTPSELTVGTDELVHLQFFGTDYNVNRQGNNGEGGPPDPTNLNEARTDRTNMVETVNQADQAEFNPTMGGNKMFDMTTDQWVRLTFGDQPIANTDACNTFTELNNRNGNNRDARERDHRNCMKLSGQKVPVIDHGLITPGQPGVYNYMNTRNNNFSNRNQKSTLTIVTPQQAQEVRAEEKAKVSQRAERVQKDVTGVTGVTEEDEDTEGGNFAVYGAAGLAGIALIVAGVAAFRNKSGGGNIANTAIAATNKDGDVVTAIYDHDPSAPGELGFKKGDMVTVTNKDASGWWEGRLASGQSGCFPETYVQK